MFSNIFQFLLKLCYPIQNYFFLLPAGFELRTFLLVSHADKLTKLSHSVVAQLVTVSASNTNTKVSEFDSAAYKKKSLSIG